MSEKAAGGRPSKYRAEYCEQAEKLCRLLGATDIELADFFGVKEQTINNWKKAHKEFFEALKRGKMSSDMNVADRLYQRAMGYSHDSVKIMQYEGEPVIVPYVEHFPPDTTAAIFWLKNRQPDKWRDKQHLDHTVTPKDAPTEFATIEDAANAYAEHIKQ